MNDRQLARFKHDTFYLKRKDQLILQLVPSEVHKPVKDMVNARVLHQQLVDATQVSSSSGKICAHKAFKEIKVLRVFREIRGCF